MKVTKIRIIFLIAVLFTSLVFIVVGNMAIDAPEQVSAGQLTTDMAELCLILFTDMNSGYVDVGGFMNCCCQISSQN